MINRLLRVSCSIGIFYLTYVILMDIVNPILDILLTSGGSPLNGPLSWQKILIYSLDVGLYVIIIFLSLPLLRSTTENHQ